MLPMRSEKYDGLQEDIRDLQLPALETFANKYPERVYHVRISITEFNCICPLSGLPDFATVKIDYVPDSVCVELKSLKLYMTAYRDVGIFHEHAVNRILDDFVREIRPRSVQIDAEFNPRGGISTKVEASWRREDAAE